MIDMNIGTNMRRLREELGLDILDVSIETGYSESHIAQIERGKRRPSLECLMDFMDFYGCDANDMFGMADGADEEDTDSVESRLKSLPAKERYKARKLIDSVLDTFAGKEGD